MKSNFSLDLPPWISDGHYAAIGPLPASEDRMRLIIRLSRLNYEHRTGGPFAAGVFKRDSGKLVALGVNRVTATHCSSAHAEVMALSLAQKALGTYDLGGGNGEPLQLVVNWRPCAMCYGAVIWSGVRDLLIAGHGPELEEITGFDEGPLPANWRQELERRDIQVTSGMLTKEALDVFTDFHASGAPVYNARKGISEIPAV